jgi:hypothetical protein
MNTYHAAPWPTSSDERYRTFKKTHLLIEMHPGDYFMKLVERMLRVCKVVIKAKGGYLKNLKYTMYLD